MRPQKGSLRTASSRIQTDGARLAQAPALKPRKGSSGRGPLPPGSRIGIIGGGQLGRMIAIAAAHMGYRVSVLDPDPDCPAAQVADDCIASPYEDRDAARALAHRSDVVTYEFENVDAGAIDAAEVLALLRPSSKVLRIAQDRISEKGTLSEAGFPVAPYRPVETADELADSIARVGLPAVLKTARMGYDGKGQSVLRSAEDAGAAFAHLGGSGGLILEQFVPFEKELSVICARDARGETRAFPCAENIHVNGILDVSIAPARVPEATAREAANLAGAIADRLGVVGLIAVEMFLTVDGSLLVNELAPRPHNSGHYTIEACATSQFGQLVRILCNLPMGDPAMPRPAVMVNMLGDLWLQAGKDPDFAGALSLPGVSLHLYGKSEVRAGRKMGHITAVAPDVEDALSLAIEARKIASRT